MTAVVVVVVVVPTHQLLDECTNPSGAAVALLYLLCTYRGRRRRFIRRQRNALSCPSVAGRVLARGVIAAR